jgi:hypothetical protein
VRVTFKGPLDKLGEIFKANPDANSFYSHSLCGSSRVIVQHGSSIKVGNLCVCLSSKKHLRKKCLTTLSCLLKELKEHYELVGRDLARHYAKRRRL